MQPVRGHLAVKRALLSWADAGTADSGQSTERRHRVTAKRHAFDAEVYGRLLRSLEVDYASKLPVIDRNEARCGGCGIGMDAGKRSFKALQ